MRHVFSQKPRRRFQDRADSAANGTQRRSPLGPGQGLVVFGGAQYLEEYVHHLGAADERLLVLPAYAVAGGPELLFLVCVAEHLTLLGDGLDGYAMGIGEPLDEIVAKLRHRGVVYRLYLAHGLLALAGELAYGLGSCDLVSHVVGGDAGYCQHHLALLGFHAGYLVFEGLHQLVVLVSRELGFHVRVAFQHVHQQRGLVPAFGRAARRRVDVLGAHLRGAQTFDDDIR
ncbi:MAG: hypothetical protein BZ138_06765 [Methanosphaera sp. rholeuAM270]|nr:MAG: hypothetical protein BZ138_06765 [Methanosphaera sp. rholeuAM270]